MFAGPAVRFAVGSVGHGFCTAAAGWDASSARFTVGRESFQCSILSFELISLFSIESSKRSAEVVAAASAVLSASIALGELAVFFYPPLSFVRSRAARQTPLLLSNKEGVRMVVSAGK